MTDSSILARNWREVRARIDDACARRQRDPQSVRLVAVTKTAKREWIRELIDLGQRDLGENRPQQLVQRAAELPESAHWHLIGHLQRNKVDFVAPHVRWIHSVDSPRLAQSLAACMAKSATAPQLLLEVNVSGESSKGGFAPDELVSQWDGLRATKLPIVGLMTMAPLTEEPESIRWVFRQLRELRARLVEQSGGTHPLPELSMGMSGDFEVAVEEGATLVRVGSRLFEGLA